MILDKHLKSSFQSYTEPSMVEFLFFPWLQVLKLYAWEPSFKERIEGYRNKELVNLKWANILNALSAVFWNTSTYMVKS